TTTGMAASRDGAAFADAHLGFASVQGILAHLEEQARHIETNFRGAARIRTGNEGSVFGPGNYFDGGNYRAIDGKKAGCPSEQFHFLDAGNERLDVPAAEETLPADRVDSNRQPLPAPADRVLGARPN